MSSDDIEKLITRLAASRGEKGFTPQEAEILIRFAAQAEADFTMVRLIRQEQVDVDIVGKEVVIRKKGA